MTSRNPSYGDSTQGESAFALLDVNSQEEALEALAKQAARATIDPRVRRTAIKIARGCEARDDECELLSIYNALKTGDSNIPGLEDGVKYMADHYFVDTFISPSDLLADCEDGACAGDCDDHGALAFALAGALGFRVGLRAWGPKGSKNYAHVYCVALVPKEDEDSPSEYGLDTSADAGETPAGWQPPEGNVFTAWMQPDDVPSNTTNAALKSGLGSFRKRVR